MLCDLQRKRHNRVCVPGVYIQHIVSIRNEFEGFDLIICGKKKTLRPVLFTSPGHSPESRTSAPGHGRGRIGNRVQIPGGCAAVSDDEAPMKATVSPGMVRRGRRMTPEPEDLLARAHQALRCFFIKARRQSSRLPTVMRTSHGWCHSGGLVVMQTRGRGSRSIKTHPTMNQTNLRTRTSELL